MQWTQLSVATLSCYHCSRSSRPLLLITFCSQPSPALPIVGALLIDEAQPLGTAAWHSHSHLAQPLGTAAWQSTWMYACVYPVYMHFSCCMHSSQPSLAQHFFMEQVLASCHILFSLKLSRASTSKSCLILPGIISTMSFALQQQALGLQREVRFDML